jgi:hypothetical protein
MLTDWTPMREMPINISGLGFILYSPPAVRHIAKGSDYLQKHFWQPKDIARHVMDCQLTGFCTGTPGSFLLRFHDGPRDELAVEIAEFKVRLGLEVHEGVICVRDLYDLLQWLAECPQAQQLPMANGWYRLTVYTSCPPSGIFGDNQVIDIHLEAMQEKPDLHWEGVPTLCD